jgi:hypothetical protein
MSRLYLCSKNLLVVAALMLLTFGSTFTADAQSVAREWNEVMLDAIRDDVSRPTVHARNLWHVSGVMYDAWAIYDDEAKPYFMGSTVAGYEFPFEGVVMPENEELSEAMDEAISYAAYRLLSHRFQNSPGAGISQFRFNLLMTNLGYDMGFTSTDYLNDGPRALGNYIAAQMIAFGLQDGANEANGYANQYYTPVNPNMYMEDAGNPTLVDPNRWQPLEFIAFIDQSENDTTFGAPSFLGPEWGNVVPFALKQEDLTVGERDGFFYNIWNDPGEPPYLDTETASDIEDPYKWGFALVAVWSGQCDPTDGVMIDASPNAIGNIDLLDLPETIADYPDFYDLLGGGDAGPGYTVNPVTGDPYPTQMVPRGDYARILAEFWADGPDSETPPGHWFTLLNYVSDHPLVEKKWNGQGEVLGDLEWDVKTYFAMGGAMHDVAVSVWGLKGWYDYIRPVSAIRWMGDQGQSTDDQASNYNINGLPLIPDHIETVELGDPLAGDFDENVGKIKLYAWRGPDYIENPNIDDAGAGWILSENWWPYQRPTFVTPPFAGYISGHSTYSRAAAELMTLMTGSPYFPGGLGEFHCDQNEFLVFEEGPSMDVTLQWPSYKDASDQCSLSRLWGGIHPPADDIPGRKLGAVLGPQAYDAANLCYEPGLPKVTDITYSSAVVSDSEVGTGTFTISVTFDQMMDMSVAPSIAFPMSDPSMNTLTMTGFMWMDDFTVDIMYDVADANETLTGIWVQVTGGTDLDGGVQEIHLVADQFMVDTENPMAVMNVPSADLITDASATYSTTITFSEIMDDSVDPMVSYPDEDGSNTLALAGSSDWSDDMTFVANFTVTDVNEELANVDIAFSGAQDAAGNMMVMYTEMDALDIDTKNPGLFLLAANDYVLTNEDNNTEFSLIAIFDEPMDMSLTPAVTFPVEDPTTWLAPTGGEWINSTTFVSTFNFTASPEDVLEDIDVMIAGLTDLVGNMQLSMGAVDHFDINTIIIGIEENGHTLTLLTVYPNPVSAGQNVTIQLAEQLPGKVNMQIYTLSGQVVRTEQFNELASDILTVNTAGLAAGMYFIHLHADGAQAVFQLEVAK